jgi:hypothetical protein
MITREEFIKLKGFTQREISTYVEVEDDLPTEAKCSVFIKAFGDIIKKYGDVEIKFGTTGYDSLDITGTRIRLETDDEFDLRMNAEYDRYKRQHQLEQKKKDHELALRDKEIAELKARLAILEQPT